jgi:2',3'-cyclic-nucleotide 2'-phosphodiesterase (5'-nucleotidase family)
MQMLETLNSMGLNLATFGNHEFDISSSELSDAINKSAFDWVSSNVKYNDSGSVKRISKTLNGSIEPIPTSKIISFHDEDGTEVRVGVIALTIETTGNNRKEAYEPYFQAADRAIHEVKGKCNFIIAVTHLDIGMDKELAKRFPEIKLIIGGHEHINSYDRIGNTIIAKADANAKTVYVHFLHYNTKTKGLAVQSRLLVINDAIEEDPATRNVVAAWNRKANDLLLRQGFEPCEILDSLTIPLDGKEPSVRTMQTNLGTLICRSMMDALVTPVDCSIFNSGSIRIDDMLSGYITQYDIFRVLPFEGNIVIKEFPGYILDSVLKTNSGRQRDGSFLQYYGITEKSNSYFINGEALSQSNKVYKVATNNYLGMGWQDKLNYLGDKQYPIEAAPALTITQNDIRKALVAYIRKNANKSNAGWAKNNLKVPCY